MALYKYDYDYYYLLLFYDSVVDRASVLWLRGHDHCVLHYHSEHIHTNMSTLVDIMLLHLLKRLFIINIAMITVIWCCCNSLISVSTLVHLKSSYPGLEAALSLKAVQRIRKSLVLILCDWLHTTPAVSFCSFCSSARAALHEVTEKKLPQNCGFGCI